MGKSFPTSFFGSDFDKLFIGFDALWDNMHKMHDDLTKNIPNYPPFNVRKVDENRYLIEMAVAGFSKQDIEVTLDDSKLIIKGNSADDSTNFLYKGIANRAFTHTFGVSDNIEVQNAELLNGMLKIWFEKIIPDHKKVKRIEVKDQAAPSATYLTEDNL